MELKDINVDTITSDELSKVDFSEFASLLTDLKSEHLTTDEERKVFLTVLKRMYGGDSFPHVDIYLKNTQSGELIEKKFVDMVNGVTRVTSENYDFLYDGKKGEIKSIRVMSSKDKDKYPVQRAMSIFEKQTCLSNTSFQQIKPSEFDSMVGVLVYKDGISIYNVPNTVFHPTVIKKTDKTKKAFIKQLNDAGKIVLSGQHKSNLTEGQIGFNELKKYLKFSLYVKDGNYYYIENGKKTDKLYTNLDFSDIL